MAPIFPEPGTAPTLDGLRLQPVPLTPEISLYLSDDPTLLWARLEAAAGHRLAAPYWASAWAGGQALGRYVLDHPECVARRTVVDVAAGSGLVAIAAVRAGAAAVVANDVDPYAAAAIEANAQVNGVRVESSAVDLLDRDDRVAEVVLAGDALYEGGLAVRMRAFLVRQAALGAVVLVGDPGRGHVAVNWPAPVASYRHQHLGPDDDRRSRETAVFRLDAG
ncbi:class I SAM-dependent methyltransferase [Spirilliplanes yamanashiensis]|uniref:Ribosomal protein L11 methyltransferase n=1 Tax=Spirilliplanes yamanashiensis TaxID=42233 RepID=A0A8J3YD00_9ACTN|nr:50S ribosomal protein L11 methyltransferase [Spirilliplanes yamanashiensis]MDP9816297.1 putative nicotinamide N-methyase [Spirilliplanes yamanashiensis]GIJ05824.1 ribosomal protein L11 methyltransferase [Spirilliplanes yamanashiensis]